ncbi:clathrin interactor EPSIN 1-like isoform X1 [Phaseolus vulgaris]|uniref:clathrin interactor EPSIN 1-like isoform X1 n=1 Tax=Phaseolus vulgaris TaxID=3885 RepID=UPI0035C9ED5F
MAMNVLWTRLGETGKDWRYVYKALAVIEYLVAHGCERAVDDIIEHTFHFSALSSFEYVEPSGKDVGLNARKKDENIVSLLNDRDNIRYMMSKIKLLQIVTSRSNLSIFSS